MELWEVEIFSELRDVEIEEIQKKGKFLSVKKDEIVIKEGEEGDKIFAILKGTLSVSSRGNIIKTLKEGDIFGEMALLIGGKRTATVKTIEDSILFEMEKNNFFKFIEHFPQGGFKILKVLSTRLKETTERMVDEIRREEAIKTLGRLAGTVIHDLKSPLTVIKGYIEFLEKDKISDDERRKIAKILRDETIKLLGMIQDFLEFARGKDTLRRMKVDILSYVKEIKEFFNEESKKRGIQIEISGEKAFVNIDPIKMKRVFVNIIQNSIDAMDKGKIEIILKENGEVIIKDNGKGMPPEVKERIFEPFFTSKSGGTGLGMTIVKKIIDDHNGSLSVWSELGKGTEIKINLPLCSS